MMLRSNFTSILVVLFVQSAALAQREFGFDNRKTSGQPYLSADESIKRFQMADGWEAHVFAAEPEVINPIAFTIDEKGRLWVVECFEYPSRTPKGKKPRDRIKIIEDTDGDGKADKVTIWAEGKDLPIGWDLASGIEVGHGGVFLGAPPYLFFLSDPEGKGRCTKQEVLLKGFGSEDTHEMLNTFQWGPDGRLYGLHGIYTQSVIDGLKMTAAVWRYDVETKKFDIFAEGTSNPWGMDFDRNGQCFLACCVIPHLFHMVEGGTYKRQAGSSLNPYAYGLLNEICDHTHHKVSGWAHAGLMVLEGETIPDSLRGSLIMGSIHGCSLKRNTLKPNGSTFIASSAADFLASGDKNLRPINLRWGQDGSIYLIDWHDQNPCHQAPPDSWDQTHGRIYRLQRKDVKPQANVDLGKKKNAELVSLLKRENPYWYRTALRLLDERQDKTMVPELKNRFALARDSAHVLRALWALHALGACDEAVLQQASQHSDAAVRSWSVRLAGEAKVSPGMLEMLTDMACCEPAPQVRSQLASTCQRLKKEDALPILHNLMEHEQDKKDPNIPLLIWLAYEPHVVGQRTRVLDWLGDHAAGNELVAAAIVPRVMRRLAASGKVDDLDAAVRFIGGVEDSQVKKGALEGLLAGIQPNVSRPAAWSRVHDVLMKEDAAVRGLAERLAVAFQDKKAIAQALDKARDAKSPLTQRLAAVRDLAGIHPAEAHSVLLALVLDMDGPVDLRAEACRALAGYQQEDLAQKILKPWATLPPRVRGEAVQLLSGRKTWAAELLAALGKGTLTRADLNDNVILRILAFKDPDLNQQVEKVWGRFRDSPKELAELIDKMRAELHQGTATFERGRTVFENQCAKCHRFEGKGAQVGPELDGAARDMEYLLANILDPNRVIGQPYLLRIVELTDGRIESGLLHAEDDQSITLKQEQGQLKTIQRKDIEGKVRVVDKSLMPEGLAASMSVQDFRDLVRYVMAHPFVSAGRIERPGQKAVAVEMGPAGRIPVPAAKSVVFAFEAETDEVIPTRLMIGCKQSIAVYLNDVQVGSFTPPDGTPLQPDQAAFDMELHPGSNRLRLQISNPTEGSSVYVRFLDPERKLRYPSAK